jgi:hypothetical protein
MTLAPGQDPDTGFAPAAVGAGPEHLSGERFDLSDQILDVSAGLLALRDLDGILQVGTHMLEQARLRVLLFSRELDPRVFDQPPFLQAMQRLAVRPSSGARIRILVLDNQQLIKRGHRLLELARRLTSSIELRRPIAEYRDRWDDFLLVDQSGYIHWEQSGIPEAVASYHGPMEATRLQGEFNEIWEHSEPDPEVRRLHL